MNGPIKRILVANRGEIAKRVIRTCRLLGIETVLAASECDLSSWPAMMADATICIGLNPAAQSYLDIPRLISVALATQCDAVHPGYGFLAENVAFARACADNGLIFIGPSPSVIHAFGNKVESRAIAVAAAVPVLPGSGLLDSPQELRETADRIGYPVLIKAAAGGGGKGMHIASSPETLDDEVVLARREAGAAFNDSSVYLERYVKNGRHIEVQVVGDAHGTYLHLGDRDCTVQRRHQKLLEEAPAPDLLTSTREELHAAALRLCKHAAIDNVATIEFLYDKDSGEYFFLEVNARIQVEHGVTELITGLDIVELQLQAAGNGLTLRQDDIRIAGHAVEARINAEDPTRDFRPSPGRLTTWRPPAGDGMRVDSHCYPGYLVPPFYDSLIAKVMARGADRAAALSKLSSALRRMEVVGIQTTAELAATILESQAFARCEHTTSWLEDAFLPTELSAAPGGAMATAGAREVAE